MYKMSFDYEKMFGNAVKRLSDYINDNKIEALVLGVSGGVDSALVAALAFHAIRVSDKTIPLIGRSITIESNKPDEIARAKAIGEQFCDDFKELDLTDTFHGLTSGDFEMYTDGVYPREYKIAMGNIKARLRMTQLYHLAGINKGMVLSTDNLTELMVGFWTLHGDVGDYGMVQNLWKTEVYGLTAYISDKLTECGFVGAAKALDDCIEATPTDGLGISDSDLDQLGAESYEDVDNILIDFLENGQHCSVSFKHPVMKRHFATHFKRENPYNIPREDILR